MKDETRRPIEPTLLTVDEACTALRVGRTHFYKLVHRGIVRTVKVGPKAVRVEADELRQVPDRLRAESASVA